MWKKNLKYSKVLDFDSIIVESIERNTVPCGNLYTLHTCNCTNTEFLRLYHNCSNYKKLR